MSVDPPPATMSVTGQKDGNNKQPASRGGWKIKERRNPAKSAPTPRKSDATDQQISPKADAPNSQERKLIIGPSPPLPADEVPADNNRSPYTLSRLRLPILLALGVIVVGTVTTPFLGRVGQSFDSTSETDPPNQALGTDQTSQVTDAPAAIDPNLLVRAIALPALEDEGALPVYFRLPTPADWPIEVAYRTEAHTAEADVDFKPETGVITIEPGETLVELSIPLIDDEIVETVELFRVILSVDPETAAMTDSRLTATVLDDDYRKQQRNPN